MQSDELEQWLLSLPLAEPVEIEGESVYLALAEGGAELGLILQANPTQAQVEGAMRTGFQGALEHHAGLALSPEDGSLLLNRWMPGAEAWSDVGEALEDLLSQASLWRAVAAGGSGPGEAVQRIDARMRREFAGMLS